MNGHSERDMSGVSLEGFEEAEGVGEGIGEWGEISGSAGTAVDEDDERAGGAEGAEVKKRGLRVRVH